MNRKMTKAIIYLMLCIIGATLLVVVAPVLAYTASAQYIVTSNSSAAANTMLPVFASVNNTYLAANGFILPSALDTRVQSASGTIYPWMVADNRTFTALPITPNTQTNLQYTTGNTPASAMDIITGYGGYTTVADSSTVRISNNGTTSVSTRLGDTSGNITDKAGAYYINYNGSNNVTAGVGILHTTNFSSYTEQDAGGFITETATNVTAVNCPSNQDCFLYKDFSLTGNFTNFTATFEINARGDAVNPFGTSGIAYTETFNDISGFAATDIWVVGNIQSGTLVNYLLGRGNLVAFDTFAGATANATYYFTLVRVGDNATCYIYSNSARTVLADTLTIAGVGATTMWRYSFGFVNNNTGVANRNFSGTISNLVTRGNPEVSCITTQGEHAVAVSINATNLWLSLDGVTVSSISTGGASIPNNTNPIVLGGLATPYIISANITKGGNLGGWWQPNTIIIGNSLPDRSGNGNTGTITWGTMPTGVTATLAGLVSSYQSTGIQSTTTPPDRLPSQRGLSDWNNAPDVSGSLLTNPLRPLVRIIMTYSPSSSAPMTETQAWKWFGLIIVLFFTGLGLRLVPRHLFVACIMGGVATIFNVVETIWSPFYLLVLIIFVIGGLVSERAPWL